MCVLHARRKKTAKEAESRKPADASCVIQLTQPQKCCNITKVVFGKVKYIFLHVYTCIQMRKMYFMNVRRQKKSKELKRCLNILQNVSVWH